MTQSTQKKLIFDFKPEFICVNLRNLWTNALEPVLSADVAEGRRENQKTFGLKTPNLKGSNYCFIF